MVYPTKISLTEFRGSKSFFLLESGVQLKTLNIEFILRLFPREVSPVAN